MDNNKLKNIIIIMSIIFTASIIILSFSNSISLNTNQQNEYFIQHELLTTISVGDLPIGIASNPITNKIYVTNNNDNTVSVIDSLNNKVINSIDVEKGPSGITVNPNTNKIYVSNYYSDDISIIDESDNSLIDVISVNDSPRNIAINNVTDKIYVVNHFGNSIDVIDGNTNSIVNSIEIERPWGISINDETNTIYVTSKTSFDIFIIDGNTNTISKFKINHSSNTYPLEVEFISGKIFLSYTNFLIMLDESTLKEIIIPVGNIISEIEVNEKFTLVYVLDTFSNVVYVIDFSIAEIIEVIPTGKHPIGIEYQSQNNILYVVNEYSNSVSVFSLIR